MQFPVLPRPPEESGALKNSLTFGELISCIAKQPLTAARRSRRSAEVQKLSKDAADFENNQEKTRRKKCAGQLPQDGIGLNPSRLLRAGSMDRSRPGEEPRVVELLVNLC